MTILRANIALVMVVRNEPRLGRAIASLTNGVVKPDKVYLVDNGSTDREALELIAAAQEALALAGIACDFRRNEENLEVGTVRSKVFHDIRGDRGIDLVTCLDGDDELGKETLSAFQQVYRACQGEVDVIVPREIVYRYDSDEHRFEALGLMIPEINTAKPNASRSEVQAWVDLTRVGATFAIRVAALAQYNGFSKRWVDDEWVWKFTGWAKRRARFAYAEVSAVTSYQYWQHDTRVDPNYARRKEHTAARRFRTARRALQN